MSVFFLCFGIFYMYLPRLALADRCSCRTPGPCFAELIARCLEHQTNSFFGNVRQPLLAQSLPQKHQGPGRGLIIFGVWLALYFGDNARALVIGVNRFPSSSRRNEQCGQSSFIKPSYQLTDTISTFVPRLVCRFSKRPSCLDGEDRSRSFHHIQPLAGGFGYAVQFLLFGRCKSSQWMVLCFPHGCFLSPGKASFRAILSLIIFPSPGKGRTSRAHCSWVVQKETIMVRGRTRKATGVTIAACWMVNPICEKNAWYFATQAGM